MNTMLLKNSFIITGALLIPQLSMVSYNLFFFIHNLIVYLGISIYYYLLVNKRKHKDPILYSWLNDKNKSRDLVFNSLISFIKYSIVIIPLCFMVLNIIGDSNHALDKDSLLSITTILFLFIWLYSFLTNGYNTYQISRNIKGNTQ
jgi:cellulose synthase/poly-beta-1,6-N-acetylglucosamine synthase-like glycosyltransferase